MRNYKLVLYDDKLLLILAVIIVIFRASLYSQEDNE